MKLNLSAFFTTIMKSLSLLPVSFSSSCLWFLMVSSLCSICFCNQNSDYVLCIPTERLALIDLKNSFIDHSNRLSSWVGKECCSWSGVVCDNITGHVHELHLRGPLLDDHMLGGAISPSVIKLLQLRHLDLSSNDFGESLIPEFIGSFQNLVYLNLSYSNFSGEIPHQLGNLSTLGVLDLHDRSYLRSKSLAWLKNLKGLRHLDMGNVFLYEASDWFLVVSNLTSLVELHLSLCVLPQLPSNITTVSFTSLVVLDLSRNLFPKSMLPEWIFSLRNLAVLDLSWNHINSVSRGWIFSQRNLSNLRVLDVSYCVISSPFLGNLNLPSIEHLDVSYNRIVEEIPKSLSNLCNITLLRLDGNKFSGNVSDLLGRFCECESPKLEVLSFAVNNLIGQLPERLGNLKNLIELRLAINNLTGTIPDSIGSLSRLQMLDINANQISGLIPGTIGGLSLLEVLDLSNNSLNGRLPESIGRLSKIKGLDLAHNLLIGILNENHFANMMSLKGLSIEHNKFKLDFKNWIPPFKLVQFKASSCNLGPQFPSWLRSQTDLSSLDVANTNISDTIPNWFWSTFRGIYYLNMSHNNIQGKLGDISFLQGALVLDLSNNHLHGMLHGNFNWVDWKFLDLSNNNLSGSLEQFLCSAIQYRRPLEFLDLAKNSMSGIIPDCWMKWKDLLILNLEKNQFFGIIPSSLGNLTRLKSLDMAANRLSGNLPPWLLNSNSLVVIELAENELTGKIPSLIEGRNATSLRVLSLRSNKFEGIIPDEICHLRSIQILDLAHNDLSGNLPRCFTNFSVISGSETLSQLVLYQATYIVAIPSVTASLVTKGKDNTYSTILYLVTSLDLSGNKFSGSIPGELFGLLGLRFLNLSHNNLTGTIPNLFVKTGKLEALDLSINHLHRNIPLSLSQLTSLNWLNVSYNNLEERIPTGPQFQTFNESSFIGNALCGAPLPVCFRDNGEGTTDGHDESDGIDWILVILTLVGLVVGFWIIITPLFCSRRWRNAYYHFLEEIWFKLQNFTFLLFLCLRKRRRSR